ncbi:hypothetical protein [Streptomyces griseocarneus]|uniref:hypothetical protein n=1 Tax=Streptomyces griseocarneus TaxID=51201 RepID=UPI00167E41E2|nr:hypothetical protein [Streptomyces griseocarneus]MBZ6473187.1 hypothetical protein [Streptomyces griseocarneus]GHG60307.1 hypothetical protein GCM10018779_27540 [Streptomyces griseocarneus]
MKFDHKAEADMRLYSEKRAAELAQKRREAAEEARSRADGEAAAEAPEAEADTDAEVDSGETR